MCMKSAPLTAVNMSSPPVGTCGKPRTTFYTDEERLLSSTADGDVKTATAPVPAGLAGAVPTFASLQPSTLQGACSIAYFLLASSAATFVIKFLFTVHGFAYPALMSALQAGVTVALLAFSGPVWSAAVWKLMPFALVYVANLTTGMMGTGYLPVPMYIALRRIGVFFVMLIESLAYAQSPTKATAAAVLLMCVGTIVAAYNDLSFSAIGYVAVTVHNIFSAAHIVMARHSPAVMQFSTLHLVFFNAALGLPLLGALAFALGEPQRAWQVGCDSEWVCGGSGVRWAGGQLFLPGDGWWG